MQNNVLVIPCVASKDDVINCRIHGDIQENWHLIEYTISDKKPDFVKVEFDLQAECWITSTQAPKDKSDLLRIVYQVLGEL